MPETETVFTLNNHGIHHEYSAFCFAIFNLMLVHEKPAIWKYLEQLDYYFTEEDFMALNHRLQGYETLLPMSLKEVIIFFATIHFSCTMLLDKEEEAFLQDCFGEDDAGYIIIRDKIMGFGTVASNMLSTEFLRENMAFQEAVEKIRETTW